MKTYLVGGAVRDEILGRPVHDRDYVVVGSTVEEMLAKGFTQVGADFPVFLHPETKEEYALARTERKTGEGHKGFETFFSPEVTLIEDLGRRDLTINAMAKDIETGEIIDPYNGLRDIEMKILRATSEAFIEDPLRILRVYRFGAQLGREWNISLETALMTWNNRHLLDEISPERKWKEMEKAMNSDNFAFYVRMISDLGQLPELAALKGVEQPVEHHPEGDAFVHTMLCLEMADKHFTSPEVKFAVLCHDFGKAVTFGEHGNLVGHEEACVPVVEELCKRLKIPNYLRDVGKFVAANHTRVHCIKGRPGTGDAKPKTIMKIIESAGNINSALTEEKLFALADACWCDAKGRGPTKADEEYFQGHILLDAWVAVARLDTKGISARMKEDGKQGPLIGEAIRVARIGEIRRVLTKWKDSTDAGAALWGEEK